MLTAPHPVSELRINEGDGGVTFEVRVAPRASRNAIKGVEDGVLKVALTAAPVEGAANAALVKLLSKALGVSKSSVWIVRGEHARNKVVCIDGLAADQLLAAIV